VDERAADDQRLVQTVLGGDTAAFRELVGRYQRMVANIAWRYGIRREEIEDVTSEVFLKVYRGLHRYRPEHPFGTWLYRLAANHVVDQGRRARRAPDRVELPAAIEDPRQGPGEQAEAAERAQIVRSALAELAPRHREALFLVYVEGLKIEEVSRSLGVPPGTIKSRLLRGRAALRAILARRR
jgi:RNA polymerase sigma-70 factor (ECF subfamily)